MRRQYLQLVGLAIGLCALAACASGPTMDPLAAMEDGDWDRCITLISEELASLPEPETKQATYHKLNRMSGLANCHYNRYEITKDIEDLKASVKYGRETLAGADAAEKSGILGEGVMGIYPDLIVIRTVQEEFLPDREKELEAME